MPRSRNQEKEIYYFRQFRSHYELPQGKVRHGDKPDVIIDGSRKIGIDITRLYLTDGGDTTGEQVQRDWREKVLARAQSLYLANGGRRIELSVDFEPEHPISDIESVARPLAELPGQINQLESGQVNPSKFEHIPELRFLYYNANEYADAKWRVIQCHDGRLLAVDRVHTIVGKKAKKLESYQPCDAYWLLIVIDFMDSAQDQELEWPLDTVSIKSPFERVIIYKTLFGKVVEVPIIQSTAS